MSGPFRLNFNNTKKESYDENSSAISVKLRGLGISGFFIGEKISGPIITGYPVKLSPSTPISKVLKLNEDIAIACGVESVDIRRIGHEVIFFIPNKERKIIDFKSALHWYLTDADVSTQELPILLGVNALGEFCTLDLVSQPHLLIAGSTGAGKSIYESNIIASLAMIMSKEDIELYLIDTKRLELTQFAELPHVKEVVRDIQEWYSTVDILIGEVSRRNKLFEASKVRNLFEYNIKADKKLPYIVVIIDEYADLVEYDNNIRRMEGRIHLNPSVDESLRRLVQICRASGVHVILCTQRTSVDIVSGVIKANFPARISLKLPTAHDSKTILGSSGAENLLDKGDLLYKSSDSNELRRFHAPFVQLTDIFTILNQREMILESLYRI